MQHDRGCVCQECGGASTTDTVLVGLMIISGVVLAITTASKVVVLLALLGVAGLAIYKLRRSVPRTSVHKDEVSKRGVVSPRGGGPR